MSIVEATVKQGQALASLEAPEMQAQIVEAESKAQALELQRAEAEAKLAAAQSTYDRLKAASATPGVVAENDVKVAKKTAEAAQALVRSYENSIKAAQAQARAVKDLGQYLLDQGAVRRDHHRAQCPPRRAGRSRIRGDAAVPTPPGLASAPRRGGARSASRRDRQGRRVPFTVPAYPGETFYGVINLVAHDLDEKTRTMPVELEVKNSDLRLSAGMYPEVHWPVRRPQASLLVPPTSVVTTTERTFVVRVNNGAANLGQRRPRGARR